MRLIILLLICSGLAIVAWYDFSPSEENEIVDQTRVASLRKQQNKSAGQSVKYEDYSIAIKNPYDNLKLANLQQTVKRPLFSQSRRPPALVQKPIALPKIIRKPKKPLPKFLLLGVLQNGSKSVALVREEDSGKYFRVVKGDFIGNVRVKDVLLKAVKLEHKDGTSLTLQLKFTKP